MTSSRRTGQRDQSSRVELCASIAVYSQYGECASCVAAASCPAAELLGVSGEQQDVRPSPAQGTPLHYTTPETGGWHHWHQTLHCWGTGTNRTGTHSPTGTSLHQQTQFLPSIMSQLTGDCISPAAVLPGRCHMLST